MSKVAVIGGGAGGMMAACIAAGNGHRVTLFEQNEKLGKKIYITGKGRCNLTNACDTEDLFAAINKLEADIPEAQALESEAQARYYHDTIFTDMSAVREPADKLEMLVAKEDWPMPSYGDLIFEV